MGAIERLHVRAQKSRRDRETPVVSSVEEARALARSIADGLSALSDDQRLLMLSNLHDVQAALETRVTALETDMSETRERIQAVTRGLSATAGYRGSVQALRDHRRRKD
ncbi:hypothetical protein [Caulobacter hibisci]|uniref:Flagellar protein FlgN n=1 Tax=Caulobacter hibisci TaxID=2035993 RepID=A0ABS0SRF4_9CAUL|nr:hypothetical protein [Caulobacter hibisci]MBI1682172.1 hypothetical protein [Caulobacter hibisci]